MSQHIDALPSRGDLTALSEQIGSMKGKVDLGDLATTAAIESALDTKLNTLGNFERMVVQFRYTGSSDVFRSSYRYSCTLIRGGSALYSFAECVCDSGSFSTIIGARASAGWAWDGYASSNNVGPFKFAQAGVQTASTSKSYNVANGSRHMVVVHSPNETVRALILVSVTSAGTLAITEIFKETNVSFTKSTNTLTIECGDGVSTTGVQVYDMCFHGDVFTEIT